MISQPLTMLRINKLGKPYVQSTDPSINHDLVENDMWLNPDTGTMRIWNGSSWDNMQFGGSAIMDNCITNRMIANDISASKIVTGILRSQDGSFYLDLETGEAQLLNLMLGGQVEGNIIATSSNGLTRVRLRGRDGNRDVTAGVLFERKDDSEGGSEWENAGQLYFSYSARQTFSCIQNYQIGAYNPDRPNQATNAGSTDGLMFRPVSTDWLDAAHVTYHGVRLRKRDAIGDSFVDRSYVMNAIGNCMTGSAVQCDGIVTCTYQMNDIMQLDFNLKITTAGSGSSDFGISRNLIRQLDANIPIITPMDGGKLEIYTSSGALVTSNVGGTFMANGALWQPAHISGGAITGITESEMTSGLTLVGTCYGKYSFEDGGGE